MKSKYKKAITKRKEVLKYTSFFPDDTPYEFKEQIYDGLGKMAEQIAKDVDEECLKIVMERMGSDEAPHDQKKK